MWHGEALRTRDPRLILMAHSVLWLTQLSEASLGLFYTVDQRLLKFSGDVIVATTLPAPGFDLKGSLLRYRRHYHVLDPFAPLRFAASPATILDSAELTDGDALARSPYFGEYLPALGMRSQITLLLRSDGQIVAGVDLLHGDHDPDLDGHRLGRLRSGHALFEHAYCSALRLPTARPGARLATAVALTPREAEVARLVARGASNAEVARALTISEATVKTHLLHVFEKLRVRSRSQLTSLLAAERHVPLYVE
jgi:DNA-binding CsgD family transcriptional regulator